jgi:uncharacterized protein YjgD (DUF1641 family)
MNKEIPRRKLTEENASNDDQALSNNDLRRQMSKSIDLDQINDVNFNDNLEKIDKSVVKQYIPNFQTISDKYSKLRELKCLYYRLNDNDVKEE